MRTLLRVAVTAAALCFPMAVAGFALDTALAGRAI